MVAVVAVVVGVVGVARDYTRTVMHAWVVAAFHHLRVDY